MPKRSQDIKLLYQVSTELREIFRRNDTVRISFKKFARLVDEKTLEALNLQLKLEGPGLPTLGHSVGCLHRNRNWLRFA